jgi:hypothetical protein
MNRHTMVIVTLSLLLSAGLLQLPVNAAYEAGPDTSGYGWDLERMAGGLLSNDLGVLLSPPRYQWNAEQTMDQADRCAEKFSEYHTKFIDRAYVVYQQRAAKDGYTPVDKNSFSKNVFSDPDGSVVGLVLVEEKDPQAIQYYDYMDKFHNCLVKNYDSALSKIPKDDLIGKAAVWDRASAMYEKLGGDKQAAQCREKANEYRDAAGAKSFLDALFEPLPEWLAIVGLVGGLLLVHRRKG